MYHWAKPTGLLPPKQPESGTNATWWRRTTALKPHVNRTTPSRISSFLLQTTNFCQVTSKYQPFLSQWKSPLAKTSSEMDSFCIDCRFATACLIGPIFGVPAPRVERPALCESHASTAISSWLNHTTKSTYHNYTMGRV